MKRKRSHYTEEFKWKVVHEVLSGKFTKEEALKVYSINSNCAILYWMRTFSGNENYREGGVPLGIQTAMTKSKKEKILQNRIKQLEESLKREQLRADLWQKLIETAEEELNIDIRKKSGAKQLQTSDQREKKQ